jgi:hypothetical protein
VGSRPVGTSASRAPSKRRAIARSIAFSIGAEEARGTIRSISIPRRFAATERRAATSLCARSGSGAAASAAQSARSRVSPSRSPASAVARASASRSDPIAARSCSVRWSQSRSSIAVGNALARSQRIAAAPSETKMIRSASSTPSRAQTAVKRSGDGRRAAGPADGRAVPPGPSRPTGRARAVEDEPELRLELGPARPVVDHGPVRTDPDGLGAALPIPARGNVAPLAFRSCSPR